MCLSPRVTQEALQPGQRIRVVAGSGSRDPESLPPFPREQRETSTLSCLPSSPCSADRQGPVYAGVLGTVLSPSPRQGRRMSARLRRPTRATHISVLCPKEGRRSSNPAARGDRQREQPGIPWYFAGWGPSLMLSLWTLVDPLGLIKLLIAPGPW